MDFTSKTQHSRLAYICPIYFPGKYAHIHLLTFISIYVYYYVYVCVSIIFFQPTRKMIWHNSFGLLNVYLFSFFRFSTRKHQLIVEQVHECSFTSTVDCPSASLSQPLPVCFVWHCVVVGVDSLSIARQSKKKIKTK